MHALVIDPYALTCPDSGNDLSERFDDFIQTLTALKYGLSQPWVHLLISTGCDSALASENAYPTWDRINDAVRAVRSVHSTMDINKLVVALLTKAKRIEDRYGTFQIEWRAEPLDISHIRNQHRPSAFVTETERTLLLCYALIESRAFGADRLILISRSVGPNYRASIKARVTNCKDNTILPSLKPGARISFSIDCYGDRSSLENRADVVEIWIAGPGEDERSRALDELIRRAPQSGTSAPNYRCRRVFWESAAALGFLTEHGKAAKLLRACVDTILRRGLAATHTLRTSASGGAPQRTSGRLKAWRRDIDDQYRLHYWQDGEAVELARVVVHNDFRIN
ncbi:MAG: hypothetical protein FJ147_27945 [Deltaproteobacteria bacterium]|nr:hypothetical protein [Deltaproteobacteria bacterium]